MGSLILVPYRFDRLCSLDAALHFSHSFHSLKHCCLSLLILQDGDIINIDVTVYLNVRVCYSATFPNPSNFSSLCWDGPV
jgi:hypothetical protein